MQTKKIALMGLGAIGAPLAHLLYRSDPAHFALLADETHAERFRSQPIFINGELFDPQVISPDFPAEEKIGLLFVCVKNYSLEAAVPTIRRLIDADTVILPLQNGVYSYRYFREQFPENVILEGFAQGPNTKILGTDIVYQNPGMYHLGKNDPAYRQYAQAAYETLNSAGVPCRLEEDIRHAIWTKMMLNVAGNALTALTELDYAMFRYSPEAQSLCLRVMEEYRQVAATQGVTVTQDDISQVMDYYLSYRGSKRTSMLEDALHRRMTENEFLAGYIKDLGNQNGIAVSSIDMLYSLMKIKEDVYLGKLRPKAAANAQRGTNYAE